MKVTVHAAKIPEAIQARSKQTRLLAGDGYVNACDDKPFSPLPLGTPPSDVQVCPACQYIVVVNREKRTDR